MNRQHLFSRIAMRFPVLYSNGARFSWQWRESLREHKVTGRADVTDGVIVEQPPCWMLRIKRMPALDRLALRLFARHLIRRHVRARAEDRETTVLYLFHPSYAVYREFIPHDLLVYHAYDDFSTMGKTDRETLELENNLSKDADLVLTSSAVVQRKLTALRQSDQAHFIPNGVDFAAYANAPFDEPRCLAAVPHPRIGYIGSINPKIDFAVVDYLTRRHPDLSFVFVGRVNALSGRTAALWDEIAARPNTYVIEPQSQDLVPALLAHCDVNCIYYSTSNDNFGSAGYPLKMHEYLASGRPVVSSDIESVREFSGVIGIAQSTLHWSEQIMKALEVEQQAEVARHNRIEVARANSWDDRVNRIMSLIEQRRSELSRKQ